VTASADRLARVPEPVQADLRRRYAEPQRAYHTWDHIAALLGWFDQWADGMRDADAVFLAILFHDAIYDPRAKDNEARSAALLAATALPGFDDASVARAVRLTEATAAHRIPEGVGADEAKDMAEFLDMDLSILAASPTAFDTYDTAIRREYRHVPWLAYVLARRRILKAFLTRPTLYFSDWGQERFEERARSNLRRRLKWL
jgi:predicted metal-dependent HD superfamily phosphohydrolase